MGLLEIILIVLLILLLIGAFPAHTRVGIGGSSVIGILLVIILVVLLVRLL